MPSLTKTDPQQGANKKLGHFLHTCDRQNKNGNLVRRCPADRENRLEGGTVEHAGRAGWQPWQGFEVRADLQRSEFWEQVEGVGVKK